MSSQDQVVTSILGGGICKNHYLGGGFKHFLCLPLSGEDFQFDEYFSDGLKPPTSYFLDLLQKNACSRFINSTWTAIWSIKTRCVWKAPPPTIVALISPPL